MFAARVFSRLRGLKQCDGILCDQPLSEEQLTALNYLRPVRVPSLLLFYLI